MAHRIRTLAEIAEEYKFSERWVRDFIRQHNIPVLRSKNFIRFDQAAVDAFEAALRVPPQPPKIKFEPEPRRVLSWNPRDDEGAYDRMIEKKGITSRH